MEIGKTIYTLRKSKNMTQDQLAQALGVSTPAVSKWETGSTYPDITLLSPLARALNTTVDNLLSFKQELLEEERNKIKQELRAYCEENGYRAGMIKSKEYLKEYPNSDQLKLDIARMTVSLAYTIDSDYTEEEYQVIQKEAITLLEQVIHSEDKNISMTATFGLAVGYMQEEKYDESEALLLTLPNNEINANHLFPTLYLSKGDYRKAVKVSQRVLNQDVQNVLNSIMSLYTVAKREEKVEESLAYANAYVAVSKIFELQPVVGFDLLVDSYLRKGDIETALTHFEKLIDVIIEFSFDYSKNPFFYEMNVGNLNSAEREKSVKLSYYKSIMMNPNYEKIKDRKEYQSGIERLNNYINAVGH